MLTAGKIIKRTIQTLAALGLIVMFGFPISAAWFERHPAQQTVLGDAFASVDPESGYFTQAQQFVTGLSKGRQALAESKRAEAEGKTEAELERKETERRRFNSGDTQEDY